MPNSDEQNAPYAVDVNTLKKDAKGNLPPTLAQLDAFRKQLANNEDASGHHWTFAGDLHQTPGMNGMKIIQDDAAKVKTLVANGTISSPQDAFMAPLFVADILSKWDNLSFHGDDGYTYKTNINLQWNRDPQANVVIDFSNILSTGNTQWSQFNGEMHLDLSDEKGVRPGLAAHEFGHAFFGLPDDYFKSYLTMPSPSNYYLDTGWVPRWGFEDSLMANSSGTVRGSDLINMVNTYQNTNIINTIHK